MPAFSSARTLLLPLLLLTACSGTLGQSPPTFVPGPVPQVSLSSREQALLLEINAARSLGRSGCSTALGGGVLEDRSYPPAAPLTANPYLTAVAQDQARDMAENRFLGHTNSRGRTLEQRVTALRWAESWQVEENLAVLTPEGGAAATVQAWLESKQGHCGALMNGAYRQVGLGEAAGQFESVGVASAGSSTLKGQGLLEVRFWAAAFGVVR